MGKKMLVVLMLLLLSACGVAFPKPTMTPSPTGTPTAIMAPATATVAPVTPGKVVATTPTATATPTGCQAKLSGNQLWFVNCKPEQVEAQLAKSYHNTPSGPEYAGGVETYADRFSRVWKAVDGTGTQWHNYLRVRTDRTLMKGEVFQWDTAQRLQVKNLQKPLNVLIELRRDLRSSDHWEEDGLLYDPYIQTLKWAGGAEPDLTTQMMAWELGTNGGQIVLWNDDMAPCQMVMDRYWCSDCSAIPSMNEEQLTSSGLIVGGQPTPTPQPTPLGTPLVGQNQSPPACPSELERGILPFPYKWEGTWVVQLALGPGQQAEFWGGTVRGENFPLK